MTHKGLAPTQPSRQLGSGDSHPGSARPQPTGTALSFGASSSPSPPAHPFCAQTCGLFVLPTVFPVTAANANYTAALIVSVLGVSAGLYYAPFIGGRHWFTGPAPNLE